MTRRPFRRMMRCIRYEILILNLIFNAKMSYDIGFYFFNSLDEKYHGQNRDHVQNPNRRVIKTRATRRTAKEVREPNVKLPVRQHEIHPKNYQQVAEDQSHARKNDTKRRKSIK